MVFTSEDSARQDAAIAEIKDEFNRLQQQEKDILKSVGVPENGDWKVNESDLTPEVRAALEEAKAKAKREGAARAARFK